MSNTTKIRTTKTRLVRIGNSRGIRIPKAVIEQLGLDEDIELSVQANRLVIRPLRHPREGWEERIRAALKEGGEEPFEEWPPTEWDLSEWEW
jgi:antitoxin MazE